jgi:manganese/zinc/iron transport system substrate-binding protein
MQFDRRGVLGGAAAAMALTLAAPVRAEAPLTVVATTGMIADAARTVGGDLVEVQALMGPGVDPHSYRQTRTDILTLTRADVVLWHGLYLEAQMEEFLAAAGRPPAGRRGGRGGAGGAQARA